MLDLTSINQKLGKILGLIQKKKSPTILKNGTTTVSLSLAFI